MGGGQSPEYFRGITRGTSTCQPGNGGISLDRFPKALVVNQSHPELNHLAEGLSRRGVLHLYVRPYVNSGHPERLVRRFKWLGKVYDNTLGRRRLNVNIPRSQIHQVALGCDFSFAVFSRLASRGVKWAAEAANWSKETRSRVVSREGAKSTTELVDVAVANFGVALETFSAIRRSNGVAILNYPIAHHRYTQRLLMEESELVPQFAPTLQNFNLPPQTVERWDKECAAADVILVGSTFVKNSFVAEGFEPSKLVVIPYGVDVSRFQPRQRSEHTWDKPLHVVFVGQIGQRKGISYLLEAYKAFRRAGTKLTLVGNFVGDTRAFSSYSDLFTHVPHAPKSEVANLFAQADVLVLPSLIEGMPLVVLEAMASGLPVIVTPNGPSDLVLDGKDGFVVPIRDSRAIADRLQYLQDHPEERESMGISARTKALQFTWDRYMVATSETILSLGLHKAG